MTACEPCAHALHFPYDSSPCTSLRLIESRTVITSDNFLRHSGSELGTRFALYRIANDIVMVEDLPPSRMKIVASSQMWHIHVRAIH